jgi:hypothetical protein
MEYDLAIDIVKNLESIKKYDIKDGLVLNTLANVVQKYDVKDLRMLNDLVEPLLAISKSESQKETLFLSPESLLQADIFEKGLIPWVSELRKEVFGKGEIPFSNRDSYIDWLKTYSKTQKQALEYLKERYRTKPEGTTVNLANSFIEGMHFTEDTPPGLIGKRVSEQAEEMGIEEKSLLMHVLLGTKIICPRWKLSFEFGGGCLPVSNLEFRLERINISYNRQLNSEDVSEIFKEISGGIVYRKSKKINKKHLELYRLVNQKNVPVKKGVVAFWKQIMHDWNFHHPGAQYGTWKGVKMAYDRIIVNMNRVIFPKTDGEK